MKTFIPVPGRDFRFWPVKLPAWSLCVLAGFFGTVDPAPGSVRERLRQEMKPIVEVIEQIVKLEGQTTIALGDFTGPAQDETNYGLGLEQILGQELEARKLVNPNSVLSVKGSYNFISPKDQELCYCSLRLSFEKNDGTELGERTFQLSKRSFPFRDSEVVSALQGLTIDLPPSADRESLNHKIRSKIRRNRDHPEEPTFHWEGTRISEKPDSLFALEVLGTAEKEAPKTDQDWAPIAPRQVAVSGGQPVVDIGRGEVYALKIYNRSEYEAAVSISIDGLDVFTFSEEKTDEGRPRYTHFIIKPGEALITGWHRNNQEALSFLVTQYGQGAISLKKAPRGKVGVVTVSFALAWEGDNVPEPEKGSRNAAGNETGLGPPLKVDLKEVVRKIGVVRSVISLRYAR